MKIELTAENIKILASNIKSVSEKELKNGQTIFLSLESCYFIIGKSFGIEDTDEFKKIIEDINQ